MSAGAHFSCHLMIVMSDTFKGAGCAKGGAFMSRYAEFRDASTTRDTLKKEAMDTIDKAGDRIDPVSNF